MITSKTIELLTKIEFVGSKQRWFSGRILACHAGGPGSIPGRCKLLHPTVISAIFLSGRSKVIWLEKSFFQESKKYFCMIHLNLK